MKVKSLFVSPLEIQVGTGVVSYGLMQLLKQKYKRVAFFVPIATQIPYNDVDLILNSFKLNMKKSDAIGISTNDAKKYISDNKTDKLYEYLLKKYEKLKAKYDFVLIQGASRSGLSVSIDFDINLELAKNFNTSVVGVLNGKDKSITQIKEDISIEENNIKKANCSHFATFINRVEIDDLKELKNIKTKYQLHFIPEQEMLSHITVNDIKDTLDAEIILGKNRDLNKTINNIKIAAMNFDNYVKYIEPQDLIIVPADRSDIIIGSMAALHSKSVPNISCILLTGDLEISKIIKELLNGFNERIPILKVKNSTFEIAKTVLDIKPKIKYNNKVKTSLIAGIFNKYIETKQIENRLLIDNNHIVTPIMFEYNLLQKAVQNKKTIVLPEAYDDRILKASEVLLNSGVVDIVLLGDFDDILHKANIIGVNISKATIIDNTNSKYLKEFSKVLYELRKHKGLTKEKSMEILKTDANYFATMMVHLNYADGMVSGSVSTTANTVRPALQIIKTKPNISIVSSIFFMCLETKVLVYGDCAINPEPNAQELASIAISSATTSKTFGIEPKIAMLSYSTGQSGTGDEVEKVKEATKLVKKNSNYLVEGPIQYDAAIEKSVAKSKLPNSKVAGDANILIFPDLNTGNNTYKAVQRSSGAVAIGPILQGLNKPINDLSRGCTVKDIINTIAITAIQAQNN